MNKITSLRRSLQQLSPRISARIIRRSLFSLFLITVSLTAAIAIDQQTYKSWYPTNNFDPKVRIAELSQHANFASPDELKDCGFHKFHYHSCGMSFSPYMTEYRGWADLTDAAAESLKTKYVWKPFPDEDLSNFTFGDYYIPQGPALYAVASGEALCFREVEIIFIEEHRGWNHVQYCIRTPYKH